MGAQADAHIWGISFLWTTQKWTKGLKIFGGRSGWCAKIQLGNVLPKVTYILASFFFFFIGLQVELYCVFSCSNLDYCWLISGQLWADSRLWCSCSVIDKTWKKICDRKNKWHTRRSQVCHWCSHCILTSYVICCKNRCMTTWNLFVLNNKKQNLVNSELISVSVVQ